MNPPAHSLTALIAGTLPRELIRLLAQVFHAVHVRPKIIPFRDIQPGDEEVFFDTISRTIPAHVQHSRKCIFIFSGNRWPLVPPFDFRAGEHGVSILLYGPGHKPMESFHPQNYPSIRVTSIPLNATHEAAAKTVADALSWLLTHEPPFPP